ncbi:hypothetical protein XENOCAPTIV_006295 [Xenoophorus captivus]|uniref:Uncharacterized protein n=1 Tax=Xenoophorus captivus TaxID=1517983 RepID=A0ABV0S7D5_9TELE
MCSASAPHIAFYMKMKELNVRLTSKSTIFPYIACGFRGQIWKMFKRYEYFCKEFYNKVFSKSQFQLNFKYKIRLILEQFLKQTNYKTNIWLLNKNNNLYQLLGDPAVPRDKVS